LEIRINKNIQKIYWSEENIIIKKKKFKQMSEKDIDETVEEIMKELRASPDYLGYACSANSDSNSSQEELYDSENPKHCGVNSHCEQN
jgi:hypothetical protein